MTVYFAYGSNMNRRGMRMRCPGASSLGVAVLDGWRFVITADRYASIVRDPGAEVHGVLWRLQSPDIAALDAYEDMENGLYTREILTVRRSSAPLRAMVYVGRQQANGTPRPGYMEAIVDAAQDWKLPEGYIRQLRRFVPRRTSASA